MQFHSIYFFTRESDIIIIKIPIRLESWIWANWHTCSYFMLCVHLCHFAKIMSFISPQCSAGLFCRLYAVLFNGILQVLLSRRLWAWLVLEAIIKLQFSHPSFQRIKFILWLILDEWRNTIIIINERYCCCIQPGSFIMISWPINSLVQQI